MSHILPNSFTSYFLSREDELKGSILSPLQIQCIQNLLSGVAEEKIALMFDPREPNLFLQQEAYKRGQLDTLKYLLVNSEACQVELDSLSLPTSTDSTR